MKIKLAATATAMVAKNAESAMAKVKLPTAMQTFNERSPKWQNTVITLLKKVTNTSAF